VKTLKETPPAADYDEVLVAGDPEWRFEAERLEKGIPIQEGTWAALAKTAERLSVPVE
jgi:LDH2 family malate/lactate/ureidoglycolate dehydrogenase